MSYEIHAPGKVQALRERIAALEAERDALKSKLAALVAAAERAADLLVVIHDSGYGRQCASIVDAALPCNCGAAEEQAARDALREAIEGAKAA